MSRPVDLRTLTEQLFAARDQFSAATGQMEGSEVSRSSGGVTVTLTGAGLLSAIRIEPAAARDIASLERHILQAHRDAFAGVKEMAEASLGPLRQFVQQVATSTQAQTDRQLPR